ncbi:MAG TPA: ATP-dependent DNA ligase, partial [Chloroflexota bacterium]
MLFSELAAAFRQLEDTSSRTTLVRVLADVFRSIDAGEGVAAIYLLQGRLAPPFVPLELSIGPRGVTEAIARAYRVESKRVSQLYDETGDLGSAAGALAESASSIYAGAPPSVRAVFDCLVELARAGGAGSVEVKLKGLADLLAILDPLSATYVCRIPLGTLRLGVGDLTILDSLSIAHSDDRSLRPELERAYNETSDLGLLAQTLWTNGASGVAELGIRVGNPVRAMLAERLPSAEAILERLGPCMTENKYDGFRCQIHKAGDDVHIFSRNLEELTGSFPELVSATREQVRADRAIIEGEALAYNPLSDEYLPFQQTMRRRRKHGIEETAAALPLRLFAFDILYLDGENVTSQPLLGRRELLQRTVAPGTTILLSEARLVDDAATLTEFFEAAIQNGLEGIMAKRPDSTYRAGARSYAWVKLKRAQSGHLRDTVDCVIIGYLFGRGRRAAFGVGA